MNLLHIVEVLFAFSFMIAIHEWGHFLAMRLMGVGVEEYCLGFPPRIASKRWGKTLYSIGSIPLGGFCKPQGGDLSGASAEEINAAAPVPGDYFFASWWKRIIILLAGPGMNFISAFFLVTMLFLIKGEIIPVEKPLLGFVPPQSLAEKAGLKNGDLILTVNGKKVDNLYTADDLLPDYGKTSLLTVQRNGKIIEAKIERPARVPSVWEASNNFFLRVFSSIGLGPDAPPEPVLGIAGVIPPIVGSSIVSYPARNAGIQDGDQIISVNGHKVSDWSEMTYLIRESKEDPTQVEFLRDHKTHTVSIQRLFNGNYKAIGIGPVEDKDEVVTRVSLFQAMKDAGVFSINKSKEMLGGVWKLVTGKVSGEGLRGTVTIMRLMYHQVAQGWEDFLSLVAVISLMLFVMNLLPLGIVDGGQIVLCLVEGIKRRPISVKFQAIYQQVGFVLVIGLMLFAVFNDFKSLYLEIHNQIH